jgi:hypothetical protein
MTPSVIAMVLADSPAACMRCARAAFDLSSALGRPMCCSRVRRASHTPAPEDAGRRYDPSGNHERNVTMSRSKPVRMLW